MVGVYKIETGVVFKSTVDTRAVDSGVIGRPMCNATHCGFRMYMEVKLVSEEVIHTVVQNYCRDRPSVSTYV